MNRIQRLATWKPGDLLSTSQGLYRLLEISQTGRYLVVTNLWTDTTTRRVSDDFELWARS